MTKLTGKDLKATMPSWAKAVILAELEHDKSDMMTDYFATSTSRRVFLAWSKHTRDLFPELRKAAALFDETAHLGPGKGRFTPMILVSTDIVSNGGAYWKGTPSHWHRDLFPDGDAPTFETRPEAEAFIAKAGPPHDISFDGKVATFEWTIKEASNEHREKYSMGAGYYLKASGRYSTGWTVSKLSLTWGLRDDELFEVLESTPKATLRAPATNGVGPTMTLNAEKSGVEIRFPKKPAAEVLDTLKSNGWRWSRFAGCWYKKDSPDTRAFATSLIGGA